MLTGNRINKFWARFWMKFSGTGPIGRVASKLAAFGSPPFYGRVYLARIIPKGYISPDATIHHPFLELGPNTFIGDGVLIYRDKAGGAVKLNKGVILYGDTTIQTGFDGSCIIGAHTTIQPRCQFSAYMESIKVGCDVAIGPNCAFYPYDHGFSPGELIIRQPLTTKGAIVIEDDAWLGFGVIVLSGVRIGKGSVIGAGSVVKDDIPDGAIAAGVPARVLKMR